MKKFNSCRILRYFNVTKTIMTVSLAMFFINPVINAQENGQKDLDVITNYWLQYSDAPNSLYHYIADQAFDLLAQRTLQINNLNSLADWQQRQKLVHETLMNIVGPFPEKTPLNAKVTRIVEKDSFRVEHIVYESQPGFYVTSSMFLPKGIRRGVKSPVVIYCSGHSADGYRNLVYQHVILNLVRKG